MYKSAFCNAAFWLFLVTSGCKQSSFQGTTNKGSATNPSNPSSTSTDGSKSTSDLKSTKVDAQGNPIIGVNCNLKTEETMSQIPSDVFFSIDVSTSMKGTLNAILNSVSTFSTNLANKGYAARFGSIGFVDTIVSSYFIPFQDAEGFRTKIGGWRVQDLGNEDLPEGGQEGIQRGLEELLKGSNSNAVKVLIYISDASAFAANRDHSDFTTQALGNKFVSSKANLGNFLFFDSVPLGAMGNGPSPKKQMQELREQATLAGSSLPFPFTGESLSSGELPNLIVKGTTVTGECN